MPQKIKIGLLQLQSEGDAKKNLQKTLVKIAEAAKKGAQIVCLEELFLTDYFAQEMNRDNFKIAEPIPGPTSEALCRAAKENRVCLIGSLFEKRSAGVFFNSAIAIDESGHLIGKYRKMHIPDDPRFYEKFYFAPGDLGVAAALLAGVEAGMLICWDQWYPEAARLTALSGAEVLFYPTAIGWGGEDRLDPKLCSEQLDAWITIQRSHAIANGVFVAAVNRVGIEQDIEFWGHSFIAAPNGQIIAEASGDREEILIAELDLSLIDEQREGWPFLRDRRIDAYQGLLNRFQK
jgi:N-carbamoylputrescine amidase